jgi:hypothetical protein
MATASLSHLWVLRRDGVVVLIGPYDDLIRRVRSQADGPIADPWARWTLTRYVDEGYAFG